MKVQQELTRHADIRTTMNVYGKAMDASKREAHGRVVRMVLASKVAIELVEPLGFESASRMETKEFCGATRPSLERKGWEFLMSP